MFAQRSVDEILVNYAHTIGIDVEVGVPSQEMAYELGFESVDEIYSDTEMMDAYKRDMDRILERYRKDFATFMDGYKHGEDLTMKVGFTRFFLPAPKAEGGDEGWQGWDGLFEDNRCRFVIQKNGIYGLLIDTGPGALRVKEVHLEDMDEAEDIPEDAEDELKGTYILAVKVAGWMTYHIKKEEEK